jgi:hypothetical protein
MWISLFNVAPLKELLELITPKSVLLSFWDWTGKKKQINK